MTWKHESSDIGNSDTTKRNYKGLHLSEKMNVLDLLRKEKIVWEVAKICGENKFIWVIAKNEIHPILSLFIEV